MNRGYKFPKGNKNPKWKGGLPHCKVCDAPLSRKDAKNCSLHRDNKNVGKHIRTPDILKKMSMSNRGRWVGEKSPRWKGGKKDCEVCGKGLSTRTGRFCYKHRDNSKIGLANKNKPKYKSQGENHWNWKGGIRPINEAIRHSIEYKVWHSNVFERDDYTCQMPGCGVRGGKLEANHIKKFSKYPELRFEVTNGITLCAPCHKKINWKEERYEGLFMEIIKTKK